jgi:hypothetical protein
MLCNSVQKDELAQWAGNVIPEPQLKPNVQMKIAKHQFFLGDLLVHGKDENAVGSTEFFLYQVHFHAVLLTAPTLVFVCDAVCRGSGLNWTALWFAMNMCCCT